MNELLIAKLMLDEKCYISIEQFNGCKSLYDDVKIYFNNGGRRYLLSQIPYDLEGGFERIEKVELQAYDKASMIEDFIEYQNTFRSADTTEGARDWINGEDIKMNPHLLDLIKNTSESSEVSRFNPYVILGVKGLILMYTCNDEVYIQIAKYDCVKNEIKKVYYSNKVSREYFDKWSDALKNFRVKHYLYGG